MVIAALDGWRSSDDNVHNSRYWSRRFQSGRPGKKTPPTGPILAAKNKSLALSNKSRTGVEATKRRNRQMNGYPVRLDESPVNAIIPIKRPSDDDVVQTAPVKCRHTESGVCANIAGFCLCTQANFVLPEKTK